MKLKIAFMYLKVPNMGDLVIYETARYIVEDILKRNNISDYEIEPIDIGSGKKKYTNIVKKKVSRFFLRKLDVIAENRFLVHCIPNISQKMMKRIWHLSPNYQYYKRNNRSKMEGADIIIFGGGGLIKFHRQNFHYFLDDVTLYAQKRNIPVLLNAQGIEGYDESNLECRILKKAINRDCVKYVSTRDDFAMLRNCYIDNPKITVKAVCDPAFWTKEAYRVKKESHTDSRKVGLNVIRSKIFEEYMYKVERKALGAVYYGLIEKLSNEGYAVELFSNGEERDTKFIDWLLTEYPDLQNDDRVTIACPASTKEFVKLLAGYDRFMAVRLHAAIIGTVLGIPNVSLVWNRKQILFGEETGLRQNFITKESFSAEKIFQHLCDAKPYEMNETYKMSVYQNLEEQIKKWLIREEKDRT